MQLIVDTSVLIAVLTGEASRPALLRATRGAELLAPASVHWEVGNALSALLKRGLATRRDVLDAVAAYDEIPIRFVDVDLGAALEIADECGLYAYDAYLIACAQAQRLALLTLDKGLVRAAHKAGVKLAEVDT